MAKRNLISWVPSIVEFLNSVHGYRWHFPHFHSSLHVFLIPFSPKTLSCRPSLKLHSIPSQSDVIPVVRTTDQELEHLRNSLPDTVVVQRINEKLSALGEF
ncbi:hypothetical protein L1887_38722 [Cichorium endivia]|nr:hypothetical protein L1887_38722 [Cichorium endivia]